MPSAVGGALPALTIRVQRAELAQIRRCGRRGVDGADVGGVGARDFVPETWLSKLARDAHAQL